MFLAVRTVVVDCNGLVRLVAALVRNIVVTVVWLKVIVMSAVRALLVTLVLNVLVNHRNGVGNCCV